MTGNKELLTSSLAMLSGGGLDDADLDRRVTRFQGALRRLRDDPGEAARIDAIAMDAERDRRHAMAPGDTIYMSDGDMTVNVTYGPRGNAAAAQGQVAAELARLEREQLRLEALLKDMPGASKPRPRRIWEWWPAFGGILVATLAAAAITAAVHASVAAASYIGIILAGTTAAAALTSLLMAWTSVRVLNQSRSGAREALELMVRGHSREVLRMEVPELSQLETDEIKRIVQGIARTAVIENMGEYAEGTSQGPPVR